MTQSKKKEKRLPSFDFIAGIVAIEGLFMWVKQNKVKIPVFQLKMQADEHPLFELIKAKLGFKERIYEYNHQNRKYVLILIRSKKTIEKIIIPIFEKRLYGTKKLQFEIWKKTFLARKLAKNSKECFFFT